MQTLATPLACQYLPNIRMASPPREGSHGKQIGHKFGIRMPAVVKLVIRKTTRKRKADVVIAARNTQAPESRRAGAQGSYTQSRALSRYFSSFFSPHGIPSRHTNQLPKLFLDRVSREFSAPPDRMGYRPGGKAPRRRYHRPSA